MAATYDSTKLSNLDALKKLGQRQKAYTDAVAARVKNLEDAGSQANKIESIKVNGTAQTIAADKSVDIAVPTKVSQLTNDSTYQTSSEVATAISIAIAKTGHASFEKVAAVPAVESAAENIMYLVMNTATKHYDIYAKIKGDDGNYTMEQLDDTTVDLTGYVEKETGKSLMTDAERAKLNNIEEGANKYVHPSHTAVDSGLYKVTVDALGHVTAAVKVAKTDITALGIPAQDTTYTDATQTAAGLMSAADKKKLDGLDTTISTAIKNATATDTEVDAMLDELFGA